MNVEREFTTVMFAEVVIREGKPDYFFNLNSDGRTSAKTPPYLFAAGTTKIPNDAKEILAAIRLKR